MATPPFSRFSPRPARLKAVSKLCRVLHTNHAKPLVGQGRAFWRKQAQASLAARRTVIRIEPASGRVADVRVLDNGLQRLNPSLALVDVLHRLLSHVALVADDDRASRVAVDVIGRRGVHLPS